MSTYGIVEADLTPDPISAAHWLELLDDDKDGAVDVTAASLIARAEARFAAWLGGALASAANIALAKPYVEDVCVYLAHFHRAQNADYKIPDDVKAAFAAAQAWAKKEGQALLAGEGTTSPPGAGYTQYAADDAEFSMDDLDRL